MPTYDFVTKAGEPREHFMHVGERPPLARWVTIEGERVKRVIAETQAPSVLDRRHVSHSLPRKGSGIERVWKKFDGSGRPYFEGKADVDKFRAQTEGSWAYD